MNINKQQLINTIEAMGESYFNDMVIDDWIIEQIKTLNISESDVQEISNLEKEIEEKRNELKTIKEDVDANAQALKSTKEEIKNLWKELEERKKNIDADIEKMVAKRLKTWKTKWVVRLGNAIIKEADYKKLEICWDNHVPVLLIWPQSSGKNTIIREYVKHKKSTCIDIPMTWDTTSSDFFWQYAPDWSGWFVFRDWLLTTAVRRWDCVNIDEVNMAHSDILAWLNVLLNVNEWKLWNLIIHNTGEIVNPHENCRIFATCNPLEYSETKEINAATLSRFVVIHISYLPEDAECELLKSKFKTADPAVTKTIVMKANKIRDLKNKWDIMFDLGTRMLEKVLLFMAWWLSYEDSVWHITAWISIPSDKEKIENILFKNL